MALQNVQMNLKSTLKFNFPWWTPTWNASTWASRWCQLIGTMFLDWHMSPGTARWPLHTDHSGNTNTINIQNYDIDLRSPPSSLICAKCLTHLVCFCSNILSQFHSKVKVKKCINKQSGDTFFLQPSIPPHLPLLKKEKVSTRPANLKGKRKSKA